MIRYLRKIQGISYNCWNLFSKFYFARKTRASPQEPAPQVFKKSSQTQPKLDPIIKNIENDINDQISEQLSQGIFCESNLEKKEKMKLK